MRRRRLQLAAVVAVMGLLGVVAAAVAGGGSRDVRERLSGYAEVPAVSTLATGEFRARVKDLEIEYTLSYEDLEGDITQAHIHFGNDSDAGGISAFLCTNLGNGPAGTQLCDDGARDGTVTGTLRPADVVGPSGQGIALGEFSELVRAIRAGVTYANVHTTKQGGGEIRAQLERKHDR